MDKLRVTKLLAIWVLSTMMALVQIACSVGIGGRSSFVPSPSIPAGDFILDADAFPPDWIPFTCEPYCEPEVVSALQDFGIVGVPGHVIQEVLYLGYEDAAHNEFESFRGAYLGKADTRSPSTEFLPPPEIAYSSPIADEQYLGCGVDVVPGCRAILRYDVYLVYFYFSLDKGFADGKEIEIDGGLTIEQVGPILKAMDERVLELLDESS